MDPLMRSFVERPAHPCTVSQVPEKKPESESPVSCFFRSIITLQCPAPYLSLQTQACSESHLSPVSWASALKCDTHWESQNVYHPSFSQSSGSAFLYCLSLFVSSSPRSALLWAQGQSQSLKLMTPLCSVLIKWPPFSTVGFLSSTF